MKVSFAPIINGRHLDRLFNKEDVFIEVQPGNVVMPRKFCEMSESILNMPVRNDDIWLVSYPRTGSTWAQEIIWLLCNNLDFDGCRNLMQVQRAPLLELSALFQLDHPDFLEKSEITESVQIVHEMPSPRFVKSHLPWHLLPTEINSVKPKIVYTSRNPKDLCVSFYCYCQLVHGFIGTFTEFCEIFLDNKAPIGALWSHILDFWNRRNEPNVLFLTYEEMKLDLPEAVRKMATFLDVEHIATPENVSRLCDFVQFDKMQKNPAVNLEPVLKMKQIDPENTKTKFIRKGQIGDWKNYMDKEMSDRFDKWTNEALMGSGLEFIYE